MLSNDCFAVIPFLDRLHSDPTISVFSLCHFFVMRNDFDMKKTYPEISFSMSLLIWGVTRTFLHSEQLWQTFVSNVMQFLMIALCETNCLHIESLTPSLNISTIHAQHILQNGLFLTILAGSRKAHLIFWHVAECYSRIAPKSRIFALPLHKKSMLIMITSHWPDLEQNKKLVRVMICSHSSIQHLRSKFCEPSTINVMSRCRNASKKHFCAGPLTIGCKLHSRYLKRWCQSVKIRRNSYRLHCLLRISPDLISQNGSAM